MMLERSTFLVLALPGVVIALALVFFAEHYAAAPLPDAAPCSSWPTPSCSSPWPWWRCGRRWPRRPSASRRWPGPSAAARGRCCGGSRFRLVAPGLAAAFCLVFLSAVTELTVTLILIPTGAQTLATQFWAYHARTCPTPPPRPTRH